MFALTSLRRQLVRRLLLAMSPLFLLIGVGAYVATQYFVNAAFDRSLVRRTYALADQVEVVDGRARVNLPVAAREMLVFDQEDLLFHQVIDPAGRVIEGEPAIPAPPGRALKAGALQIYDAVRDGQPVRIAAFALSLAGTRAHGTVLVRVGETLTRRRAVVARATLAMMIPLLLLTLAAVGVITLGVRRGLHPLEQLRNRIAARQTFDLRPVPCDDVPAELRPVLDEINALLTRLAAAVEAQSRFVADAAHQLRTPIAGIRAQAETALTAGGDAMRALTHIAESARNMGELVTKLLMLARVDAAETQLRLSTLDGAALAQACCRDWAPRAIVRGVEIAFDRTPGDAMLKGDALLLKELLGNIIDNALRYGAGRVDIVVGHNQGTFWLVTDDGPGIPPAQRATALAPFHRLVSGTDGAGLGLTIVERIARLHGAQLTLEDTDAGNGLAVRVEFPPVA